MIDNQNEVSSVNKASNFNLKKTISSYIKHWKWFALSAIICLGIAYAKLRYTTPKYAAVAKIMLMDESTGDAFGDLSMFSDREDSKIDDEIQVIKSRNFLRNIVNKLNLNILNFLNLINYLNPLCLNHYKNHQELMFLKILNYQTLME